MTTVAVVSGGLDSVTMAYSLRAVSSERIIVVSFDYGQRHRKELECAARCAEAIQGEHRVCVLPWLRGSALTDTDRVIPEGHYADASMNQTVVPNRNMVMLSVAISVTVAEGARQVAIGVHAGDHPIYPDCRPEFVDAMTQVARIACDGFILDEFVVLAPFLRKTKAMIVTEGARVGVPFDRTWSCYQGLELHCGRCGTCVERREAFQVAGVDDPTRYE